MNGLPYYKAYPRDFIEGTIGMGFELKCAYRFILDLIYLQGGKLPDNDRYLSGLLECSVRKWTSLRAALISAGKIQAVDGHLTNYRAIIELETLAKLQDKQRQNATGSRKNKDLPEPRPSHTEPDTDTEEEKRATLSKRERGTRLPGDFVPEPGIASTLGLTRAEFAVELPLFRDYWTAKAGPGAIKMDWQATWRNWCRKVVKDRRPQARNGPAPPDKPQSIGEMFRKKAREQGILHDEHSDPVLVPLKRLGPSH
jgi:uncharacterized protein YdaU (DUF1376 family)